MEINFEDYKIGREVPNGKISNIFFMSEDFILFEINKNGAVNYEVKSDKIDLSTLNCLNPCMIKINSLTTNKKERRKYAGNKANAMSDCFQGQSDSGLEILENLLISIKKYKTLKSRLTYMISSIIFVLINLTITALINTVYKEQLSTYLVFLFTIATFGSMGGLISVLTKIPSLDLDLEGGYFLQAIDGFSRIFLSMISSVIIYTLIKSNIILGAFNEISNDNILYAFSIISGFSEKFIPDMIKSIEKKKVE